MWERFIPNLKSILTGSTWRRVLRMAVWPAGIGTAVLLLVLLIPIVLYMMEGIPIAKLLGVLPVLAIFTFVFGWMAFMVVMAFCIGTILLLGASISRVRDYLISERG